MKINVLSLFSGIGGINMGFSLVKRKPTDVPMRRSEVPLELWDKHRDILKNYQHIYTDFTCENVDKDWIVAVDISKSRRFGLHYLRHRVRQYFESQEQFIVSTDKIQDIILYVRQKQENQNIPDVTKYCQYSLRIQDRRVSSDFEMVVSFSGLSYVYKKQLSAIGHLNDKKYIGRVVIDNNIYSYKDDNAYICNRISDAYPVISNELKRELKLEYDSQPRTNKELRFGMKGNKYIRQNSYEDLIRQRYLISKEFKSFVKLYSDEFITLDQSLIHKLPPSANQLLIKDYYGNTKIVDDAIQYKMHGNVPYDKGDEKRKIRYFFIYQKDQQGIDAYNFLTNTFQNGAFPQVSQKGFPFTEIDSLAKAMKQMVEPDPCEDIAFSSLDNAINEVRTNLETRNIDTLNYRYIAIYISPISKDSWDDPNFQYTYARIREQLLMKSISMQGFYQGHLSEGHQIKYHFTNLYAAILAKVGGAPWVIPTNNLNDLIIGIGAFCPNRIQKRYLGTAFRFDSNGRFHEFDCIPGDDHRQLASKMRDALITFIKERGMAPKRVFIHFYKKMNNVEWKDFMQVVSKLGIDIPIITATIYKSEESTMVGFDENEKDMMPFSGTYIKTGDSTFLLYNNVKYDSEKFQQKVQKSKDPSRLFLFPLKVEVNCRNYKEEEKSLLVDSVLVQCYQLSRMCWSTVDQQNLPITVKYPSMLAKQVPFFENDIIPNPEFACSNLWFI
jgi:hypothetical protein